MFTIYGALHPKTDVYRLYIPRKEEGRGFKSIEDCVELAIGVWNCIFMEVRKINTGCYSRQDGWFRSCNCFEQIKERKKFRRLGGEGSTWSVFEADLRSKK